MPEGDQTVYGLYRGETLLGTITPDPTQDDFPWFGGIFEPSPGYEEIRSLFGEELRLLNADRMDEWGAVYDEIERPGLRLEPLRGGKTIAELLIHIDGRKTWWRC